MLGRFFPGNWRPPADEIAFARVEGFAALQLLSVRAGTIPELLRGDPAEVGAAFAQAGVEPVVEMLVRIGLDGRDEDGRTPAEALAANLDAIGSLGAVRVHEHLVPVDAATREAAPALEKRLPPLLAEAVAVAAGAGLKFGVEHNSAEVVLLAEPAACERLLEAVPGLGFVWDVNHTRPEHRAAFEALLGRATLVHLSDTPLPATNHHLPLGRGSVDLAGVASALETARYDGPVVLEIGGLPHSGGPGLDTDEALRASRRQIDQLPL